ncbi:MAG TPA: 2-phosphosulfolactate phosphatase, partial [Pirellulales bacterium]
AGSAVVVMDVLRATTTLAYALAAGAAKVIACLEVDEARRIAASLADERPLLGGERGGLRIEGFDLGNSPSEYTPEAVSGRTLVFTTTNGTRAMLHCRQARRVLLGSMVNRQAVVRALADEEKVDLVCAGTRGQITREDALCAGALVAGVARGDGGWQLNDQARLVLAAWQGLAARGGGSDLLAKELCDSQGGRNLLAEGLEADIPWAAQIDRFDLVPRFDPADSTVSVL